MVTQPFLSCPHCDAQVVRRASGRLDVFYHGHFVVPVFRIDQVKFPRHLPIYITITRLALNYIHTEGIEAKRKVSQELAMIRDKEKCVDCRAIDRDLIVHACDWCVEHTALNNQVTLCNPCHDKRHTEGIFGYTSRLVLVPRTLGIDMMAAAVK